MWKTERYYVDYWIHVPWNAKIFQHLTGIIVLICRFSFLPGEQEKQSSKFGVEIQIYQLLPYNYNFSTSFNPSPLPLVWSSFTLALPHPPSLHWLLCTESTHMPSFTVLRNRGFFPNLGALTGKILLLQKKSSTKKSKLDSVLAHNYKNTLNGIKQQCRRWSQFCPSSSPPSPSSPPPCTAHYPVSAPVSTGTAEWWTAAGNRLELLNQLVSNWINSLICFSMPPHGQLFWHKSQQGAKGRNTRERERGAEKGELPLSAALLASSSSGCWGNGWFKNPVLENVARLSPD